MFGTFDRIAPEVFLNGRVELHCGDCRDVLATLPENSLDACVTDRKARYSPESHRALEIGKAAEHIVCADLILKGHRAFLVDQGLPYDVVFDHAGKLLRVQVKSTARARPTPGRPGSSLSYMFHVRRAGKGAKRVIATGEFDLLALVALDIRTVAYLAMTDRVLQTIHLRVPGPPSLHANKRHDNFDVYPIERVLAEAFA